MIASTGFFGPNILYGDVTYAQVEGSTIPDPTQKRNPEDMFTYLVSGSSITIDLAIINKQYTINWAWITGGLFIAAILIAWAVGSLIPLAIGLITSMFLMMYTNSKTLFDQMLTHLDSTVGYVGLMIGVGILLVIVLTIMDISTGHKNV